MNRYSKSAIALFLFGLAPGAHAGCTVDASALAFGAYDVSDHFPKDSAATVIVSCHEVVARDLVLRLGPSTTSGIVANRQMRQVSGNDLLEYNLFTDPSHSQIWGNGADAGGVVMVNGVSRQSPAQVYIHGRIPPDQDVGAGIYGDFVTLTVEVVR